MKAAIFGGAGIILGCVFLWLAVRDIDRTDVERTLLHLNPNWLIAGVAIYLVSIAVRCVRWGVLLRATDNIKWRHAAEALLTGFAANFVLPGRIGELFRADYARRVFDMSRFTSLGTIVIERLCDGLVLVGALWIGLSWIILTRVALVETSRVLTVGIGSSFLFGLTLVFVLMARRIDLRRFGIREAIAMRWDLLVKGITSVMKGNMLIVVLCSICVMALDALTLASIVRGFGISLALPEALMLLGLASLSTLLPTAPGYVGTYQLVFGHLFQTLGYPQTIGVMAATAVQIFCFGSVTILGGFVLLSRSGLSLARSKMVRPKDGDSCATP